MEKIGRVGNNVNIASFLYRNYEHANLHVICKEVTEYFFLSF